MEKEKDLKSKSKKIKDIPLISESKEENISTKSTEKENNSNSKSRQENNSKKNKQDRKFNKIKANQKYIQVAGIASIGTLLLISVFTFIILGGKDDVLSSSSFKVTGDVANEVVIDSFEGIETTKIIVDEEKYTGIKLSELLKNAEPIGNDFSIFISAPDGVMAEIYYEDVADDSIIFFSKETGWTFDSPSHPKQTGIKGINNIVLISNTPSDDTPGVHIINDTTNLFISCGELFTLDKTQKIILEGEPVMGEIEANAYSTRELIKISDYTGNSSNIIGYFKDGSQEKISGDGYILWRGNTIDYIAPDGKSITEDIIGIWADAPSLAITDIREIVESTSGDVMIIEVDGLGMNTFTKYKPSFLYSKDYDVMRTVMPSISNVALASIVSGETPDVTGITSRKERQPNTDDMFEDKNAIVIEGYSQLISMSIDQNLNSDKNGDGSTDDEVFAAAKKALTENYELSYVHFHGYDDACHDFGPFSQEAENKLNELDGYIQALSENFNGTILIVSDHGQHPVDEDGRLGNHGNFYYSDMAVPFIIFEV